MFGGCETRVHTLSFAAAVRVELGFVTLSVPLLGVWSPDGLIWHVLNLAYRTCIPIVVSRISVRPSVITS